jgi:hypothetical protein
MALCNAIADPWIGHGKRKGIPHPKAPHRFLNEIPIQHLGRMILPSVDDGDAGRPCHQTLDHFIARRLDPCESKDFHHKGKDQGDGLGLMNDWIIKGRIVHLHRYYSSKARFDL